MSMTTAPPSGVAARLPTTIGMVRSSRSMVCAAAGPPTVPGLADGSAHVLLVDPAVEHPDVQEVGHRARARRCRHLLGEVRRRPRCAAWRLRRSTSAFHSASTSAPESPRRASTSASLNWPIGFFTCSPMPAGIVGRRQALQHAFGADEVRRGCPARSSRRGRWAASTGASSSSCAERRRPIARSPRACRWCRSGIMGVLTVLGSRWSPTGEP